MQPRQFWLTIATCLGLAFAAGLLVDSVFGSAHIPPFSASIECEGDPGGPACQSAQSTAVIAWWTRFDALLSIGTGLAAFFAFLAYRESREARIASEDQAKAANALLHVEQTRSSADVLVTNPVIIFSGSETEMNPIIAPPEEGDLSVKFICDLTAEGQSSPRDLEIGFEVFVRAFGATGFREISVCGAPRSFWRHLLRIGDTAQFRTSYSNADLPIDEFRSIQEHLDVEAHIHIDWTDMLGQRKSKSFSCGITGVTAKSRRVDLQNIRAIG